MIDKIGASSSANTKDATSSEFEALVKFGLLPQDKHTAVKADAIRTWAQNFMTIVGGHAVYWQHLVCTISSGQRRYVMVGYITGRWTPRRSRVEVSEAHVALENCRRSARPPSRRLLLLGTTVAGLSELPCRW